MKRGFATRCAVGAAAVAAVMVTAAPAIPTHAAPGAPRPAGVAHDKVTAPTYPTTYTRQRFVRMDDGVKLGVSISFPSRTGTGPAHGRFPVVLDMTPYGRDGACSCDSASYLATRGFVLAVADVRGTGGSQGNLNGNYFSPRQAHDGAEMVQFLGRRPWSSGKVGMSGGSYLGIMQYLVAERQPSHLAAIAPDEALSDLYNDAAYPGGILSMSFDAQYLAVQGAPGLATPNSSPSMLPGTIGAKLSQAEGRSVAFAYLKHNTDDTFYRRRSPWSNVGRIHVPVFVIDGWRDAFAGGNLRMAEALERHHVPTYIHIDPCTHKGCGGEFAPLDNPPDPDNVEAQEVQFFSRYLTSSDTPALPRTRVYVQQANRYVNGGAWPLPSTRFRTWHLTAAGLRRHTASRSNQTYLADPAAGLSMALDEQGTVAASPYLPLDQRLEDNQGLTWRTATLRRPMTLNGPIALRLVASSSATDTDWFAKLSDVSPDGSEHVVTEGRLRASMRQLARSSTPRQPVESLRHQRPITPGRFYVFHIAIDPTAYQFAPGDRLQLRLTSYNMPNALPATVHADAANPGTVRIVPLPPARNTIRVGGTRGSTLTLPRGRNPGVRRR